MENLSSRANKHLDHVAAWEDRKEHKMDHDADIQKKMLKH